MHSPPPHLTHPLDRVREQSPRSSQTENGRNAHARLSKPFVSVLACCRSWRAGAGQAAAPDQAGRCRQLPGAGGQDHRAATCDPDRRISTPTAARVGTTQVDVPFCRIVGVATPTSDSHIGFEVWLPPAAAWNGKFQGEGSGGSAGAISPGPMLTALKAGYATMSTDNGHITDPDAAQWRQRTDLGAGSSGKDGGFRLPRPACLDRRGQTDGAAVSTARTPANPISSAVRKAAITP